MTKNDSLRFQIRDSLGVEREASVDAGQVLVGSAAHCDVKLAVDDAAAEQLVVEARDGRVMVEVLAASPPVLLGNAPFVRGCLEPESHLRIGALTVAVRLEQRPSRTPTSRLPNWRSVLALGLAAACFTVSYGLVAATEHAEVPALSTVAPAPLWRFGRSSACPHQDQAAAAARAERDLVQAEAMRERAPFNVEDGLAAVPLFRSAAVCLRRSGQERGAASAEAAAARMAERLEADFHRHHVSLERALATEDREQAGKEVRALLQYVGRDSSQYTEWLLTLSRRLEIALSEGERP